MAEPQEGVRYVAAYRKWMGLEPFAPVAPEPSQRTGKSVDPGDSVELVVLSVTPMAARCRLVGSDSAVILRMRFVQELVPGEIITLKVRRQWRHVGHVYPSGAVESKRLAVESLGLVPPGLKRCGLWDPREHRWGDEGEPIEDWAMPIIARGPRSKFEMEQILPGENSRDPRFDPIVEVNILKDSGNPRGAYKILMELCQADLRCLDAHAHLGNLIFDGKPEDALRHYEAGFRIGELSLSQPFEGLLPWNLIDDRPFLRCMNGFALCLWRLGRFEDAEHIFGRMLWLNPTDNQGVRLIIGEGRAGNEWR